MAMRAFILFLLLCSACLLHSAEAIQNVNGFLDLDSVAARATLVHGVRENYGQQRIFPNITFNCHGNITKWSFVAQTQNLNVAPEKTPELQVWRKVGGSYMQVGSTAITENGVVSDGMLVSISVSGIEFQPGDMLGLSQPLQNQSRIAILYQKGGGPTNYVAIDSTIAPSAAGTVTIETSVQNDYPLVSVEFTTNEGDLPRLKCVTGFLQRKALSKHIKVTKVNSRILNYNMEQRIFLGINFTCSGRIRKWIIGAQWDPTLNNVNQYPELQIWRCNQEDSTRIECNRTDHNVINDVNTTAHPNVYEYVPPMPLEFRSGDRLGLYQPPKDGSQLVLYYNNRNGQLNYQNSSRTPMQHVKIMEVDDTTSRGIPLVVMDIVSPATGGIDSTESCVQNAIAQDALIDQALLIGDFTYSHEIQLIIPGMSFSSTGMLTKWVFAARDEGTVGSRQGYPELQIWRPASLAKRATDMGTTYMMAHTISMVPDRTGFLNVYEYRLGSPILVRPDDVLGIYQPPENSSRLSLSFIEHAGPLNYVFPARMSMITIQNGTESLTQMPLVSAEVLPTNTGSSPITQLPSVNVTVQNRSNATLSAIVNIPPSVSVQLSTAPPTRSSSQSVRPTSFSSMLNSNGIPASFSSSPDRSSMVSSMVGASMGQLPSPSQSTALSTTVQMQLTSSPQSSLSRPSRPQSATPIPTLNTNGMGSQEQSFPVATIVAIVVGITMAVFIGALIIAVMICIKRQRRKDPVIRNEVDVVMNPVYSTAEGITTVNGRTAEAEYYEIPVMTSTGTTQAEIDNIEELQPYEVPAVIMQVQQQQQPIYQILEPPRRISNSETAAEVEVGASTHVKGPGAGAEWYIHVPTEEQRRTLTQEKGALYASLEKSQQGSISSEASFSEEHGNYWRPATDSEQLYQQLTSRKFREIPRHQIRFAERIGSGQFGIVNKGTWQSARGIVDVAVKMLPTQASEMDVVKFLQEAAINGQFRHPNVVKLLGMVTIGKPVMMVLELMENGDLRTYLINSRPVLGEEPAFEWPSMLLGFCQQTAAGMEYLSMKGFIHRDLAARNILLSANKICKIGDFGMSRDLEDDSYYITHGGKIPVKWTAPEVLHYKKYSTASDVWSFGAAMYEIWSLGHKPFEGYTNVQAIKLLEKGYRLPPPPGCPREIYKIMIRCWHPDKSSRLTFSELLQSLSQPETELLSWLEEDLGVHPQATVLGAPLEAGENLYPELQKTYQDCRTSL